MNKFIIGSFYFIIGVVIGIFIASFVYQTGPMKKCNEARRETELADQYLSQAEEIYEKFLKSTLPANAKSVKLDLSILTKYGYSIDKYIKYGSSCKVEDTNISLTLDADKKVVSSRIDLPCLKKRQAICQ